MSSASERSLQGGASAPCRQARAPECGSHTKRACVRQLLSKPGSSLAGNVKDMGLSLGKTTGRLRLWLGSHKTLASMSSYIVGLSRHSSGVCFVHLLTSQAVFHHCPRVALRAEGAGNYLCWAEEGQLPCRELQGAWGHRLFLRT